MDNQEEKWIYNLVYQNKEENADKFWRARVENKTLFVNFGRNGTRGTTTVQVFDTVQEALDAVHERGQEKRDKGYKYLPTQTAVALPTSYTPVKFDTDFLNYNWGYPRRLNELPAYKSTQLDKMPDEYFQDLDKRVAEEKSRRLREQQGVKDKKNANITALQNFLLCCAHAMACRAALRWSAGHEPFGKDAADGKPWNAYDGAQLSTLVSNGRHPSPKNPKPGYEKYTGLLVRSNPLLWTTKGDLEAWLKKGPYWTTNAAAWFH